MDDEALVEPPPRQEAPPVPPTPVVGNFRKNVTNCMLVKDELGKVRQTTYNLPGPHHTYGKALFREDEGTGEMIMSWQEHVPNPHAKPGRDFKALNKGAVISGAVTAAQHREFRQTHDARLKIGTHEDRRFSLADEFVHGKSTRPSTPIQELVSSAYRWSWVADHLEEEARNPAPQKSRSSKPASTKASRGHASGALAKSQALEAAKESMVENKAASKAFTMKRFQNVPAKVTKYLPPGRTGATTASAAAAAEEAAASPDAGQALSAETQEAELTQAVAA